MMSPDHDWKFRAIQHSTGYPLTRSCVPGGAEDAQPVLVRDLGQILFTVAGVLKDLQEVGQSSSIGEAVGHLRAVEV